MITAKIYKVVNVVYLMRRSGFAKNMDNFKNSLALSKRFAKRAQFFILAAVVISAVILSFGFTTNRAGINYEDDNFKDFTYEVQRETGAVLDYEVYTLPDGTDDLEDFVHALATDLRDRDTDSNFIFVYGNNTGLTIKNYGKDSVWADNEEIEGASESASSKVTLYGFSGTYDNYQAVYDGTIGTQTINPCTKYKQCIGNVGITCYFATDCELISDDGQKVYRGCNMESTDSNTCQPSPDALTSICVYEENICTSAETEEPIEVEIEIAGQFQDFKFGKYNQVIFVQQKTLDSGDNFVAVS